MSLKSFLEANNPKYQEGMSPPRAMSQLNLTNKGDKLNLNIIRKQKEQLLNRMFGKKDES
jgi:hypothetical protein